jgi:hypothetical protein
MNDETRTAEAVRYAALRFESIREAVSEYSADPDSAAVSDMPLDVEVLGNVERDKYRVTVLLGTGGPHDELIYAVSGGSVDSVEYRYADWGWSAYVPLSRDQADTAEAFLDAILDVGSLSEYINS